MEEADYIGASTQPDDMLANLTDNGGNEFLFLGCAASDNASHPTKSELEAAGFTVYEQQAAIERWNFHKADHLGFGMTAV